jgi:hypothetical protein
MPSGHDETFRPDFFGSIENAPQDIPFAVSEIKKPGTRDHLNNLDQLKLFCEMKLMLHSLLENSVEDPEVIGFLFQGMFRRS